MTSEVTSPFPVFYDRSGQPLDAGYIYVGPAGISPEVSPITVYWDTTLTTSAAQPIRTLNGYPSRDGSPSSIVVYQATYSVVVRDSTGALVYSNLNVSTDTATTPETVESIAALRLVNVTTPNTQVILLLNYFAGDGGGTFRVDTTDTTTADDSGIVIVDAIGRRWKRQYDGAVNAQWFGINPSAADNSTANGYLQAWINAQTVAPHVYYPPGNYLATTPVTFSRSRLKIECAPGVTFTSLGSNPALVLDGGPLGFMVGAALLGWPRCRTSATSGTHAVYIRSYHHGVLQFVIDGAGTSSPGFLLEFGVCPHFQNIQVCKNETNDQWYNSGTGAAIPLYSGKITRRANGDEAGYPMFTDPVFEDGVNGLFCDYQVGTQVFGGTMENFTGTGFIDTANSRHTKMYGTDFEANATRDLDIYGYANEFHGIDTELEIKFRSGADRNMIIGGSHKSVVIDSGALNTIGHGFVYDRFSTTGTLTDNGTRSSFYGIFDRDLTTPVFRSGNPAETTVVPGGVDYFYTNTTGNNIRVRKIGGSETFVGINGNPTGAATGQFLLAPGDVFQVVTITVAPTIIISGC
jgi:hypothetical protein